MHAELAKLNAPTERAYAKRKIAEGNRKLAEGDTNGARFAFGAAGFAERRYRAAQDRLWRAASRRQPVRSLKPVACGVRRRGRGLSGRPGHRTRHRACRAGPSSDGPQDSDPPRGRHPQAGRGRPC